MPRPKKVTDIPTERHHKALTPEARENQMIALAVDLAEEKLRNGTASSQLICHYLNLATKKYQTENEILEKKKDLMIAQREALESSKAVEAMYAQAIEAMRIYSGNGSIED